MLWKGKTSMLNHKREDLKKDFTSSDLKIVLIFFYVCVLLGAERTQCTVSARMVTDKNASFSKVQSPPLKWYLNFKNPSLLWLQGSPNVLYF